MKVGDIVKHRLNKMKMIIIVIGEYNLGCKWFDENDNIWKADYFVKEELILFKEYQAENNTTNSTARK